MTIEPGNLEEDLRSTIAALEKRILTMVAIRDRMQMLLPKRGKYSKEFRHGSNSIGKQMITRLILEEIQRSAFLSTQELYGCIQPSAPTLKYTTFRSYLHRLKEQGMVSNGTRANGGWRITKRDRSNAHD